MKPLKQKKNLELFSTRLEEIINLKHPLVQLAQSIKWDNLEEKLGEKYTEKMGAPSKPIRLMVALHSI